MGEYADEALERDLNEYLERNRPLNEGEEVCDRCGQALDNCFCLSEHPREV